MENCSFTQHKEDLELEQGEHAAEMIDLWPCQGSVGGCPLLDTHALSFIIVKIKSPHIAWWFICSRNTLMFLCTLTR